MVVLLLFFNSVAFAQKTQLPDHPWYFLNTERIGAYDFIKQHPTFDGRGVLIVVCDSGVDMGVPGLLKTSDDKIKVLDAQDFSGQGDIRIKKAEVDSSGGITALISDPVRLTGFAELQYQPEDSVYWIGYIDEKKQFQNAGVADINNNGNENDLFGFITFPVKVDDEERWVYYVDENADGSLLNEKPRFDYKYNYDTFTLSGRNIKTAKTQLTFVLNIRPEEKTASLHACDVSHGTHCAGIAAGYRIFGEPSQHGIAPGAQVISCKIGDGTLSGGATTSGSMKKAFEYGIEWGKEHNVPVVFSMSYGIGSEYEGRTDIEKYLNKLMSENENILVVTSNGNEGPGLSSAGNPAGAERIISVGALLPYNTARDSYGFTIDKDRIFHFSSRGGEVNKPDLLAPGSAASTVPKHASRENMWGTSMACPQVSGAAAVLISACIQEKIPYNGALIKRALKYSATPVPGYTPLDQGTGVINIPRAFEILKLYARRNEAGQILDYQTETDCPNLPDGLSRAAFWRTGSYFPPATEKQNFTVKAIFPKNLTADQRAKFYRAYNLKSDQPWFKLDKSSTYIKGKNSARFGGYYDHSQMKKPGLYVNKITAYPKSGSGKNIPEFAILNSVIVPYQVSENNKYQMKIKNKTLKSGDYHRYFVSVPPGASSMNVELSASPGKWCGIFGYIYDPEGVEMKRLGEMDPETKKPLTCYFSGEDIKPGVWEIIPYAYHDLPRVSAYDMTVSFAGVEVQPERLESLEYKNGEKPGGEVTVTNLYDNFEGTASGRIQGYAKETRKTIDSDVFNHQFKVNGFTEKAEFRLEMDKETWNLFTDIAVNIRDKDNKILASTGFTQRSTSITFNNPSPGEYTLEIIAGFTYPEKKTDEWEISMTEKFYTKEKAEILVTLNDKSDFNLYPGVQSVLKYELEILPAMIPGGYRYFGEIKFTNIHDKVLTVLPVSF